MSAPLTIINPKIQIPVGLIDFVLKHKMQTSFSIYVFLKAVTAGKFHKSSKLFSFMREILQIHDKRTMKKHLKILLDLNWVGYNPKSGIYFVRGFGALRKKHGIKSR